MANCDDIFNQIQDLTNKRDALKSATEELNNIDPEDLGKPTDEDIIRRATGADEAVAAGAAEDVAKGRRSDPQKDRFNNALALVNRVGDEQAVGMLTTFKGLDQTWKEMASADYATQVASFSREQLAEAIDDAAQAAGLNLGEGLVSAVQRNLAPFLPILKNQASLKAYAEISRAGLTQRQIDLEELLEAGEYGPGELGKAKTAVVDSYLVAMNAQRARNIARRRSGQLLRNERDLMESLQLDWRESGAPDAPVTEPKPKADAAAGTVQVDPEVLKRIQVLQKDINEVIGETVGATAEELAKPDSDLRRIIEAANQGAEGVPEMKRIRKQMDAAAELGDDSLEKGGKFGYERYARAGSKDSILGGIKSIVQNNYISQKVVFAAEGLMAIPSNAARIYVNNRRNPVATAAHRDPMKAMTQGSQAATRANLIAESVIKQSMWKTFTNDIFEDTLPFAGNRDQINSQYGQMSIEDQYKVGAQVWGAPIKWDVNLPLQIRDKIMWGGRLFMNHHIQKAGGPRLPVLSILQLNSVIDNRAGLRTYMTDRANELQLQYLQENPGATPKAAQDYAQGLIEQELYNARPSDAQVQSFRDQYDVGKEVSNDAIRETIALRKVGQPVLDTPGRQRSMEKSVEFRMQGDTASNVPGLSQVYAGLANVRKTQWGDAFVPFLKSWAEQTAWDLGTGGFTTVSTALQIADIKRKGGVVTPELYGKAAGSLAMTASLMTLFTIVESMGEDSPVQFVGTALDDDQEQYFRNTGRTENTIFFKDAPPLLRSLPIGNMPLVKTLLLYKDLKEAISKGVVSDVDKSEYLGLASGVFAGLLLRAPGMYQAQWLMRALNGIGSEGGKNLGQYGSELTARVTAMMNPASGLSRTAGQAENAITGSDWDSLINSSRVMEAESDLIDKLPPDHPLKSNMERLRRFVAQGGTPELVRLLGGRDRKFTYWGRKWNSLEFLPPAQTGQWPDGVPALQIGDDFAVESEADRIGVYNEPAVFRNHVLSGTPVTPQGINDLERISGTMTSRGFERSVSNGRTTWANDIRIGGGTFVANGQLQERKGLLMTPFLSRLVEGRTWREAMNALFTSDEYSRWNSNPETTNQGNMSDAERAERPGTLMAIEINKHYNGLLPERFEEAGLNNPQAYPGAAQYLKDQRSVQPSFEQMQKNLLQLGDVTYPSPAAQ